MKVGRTVTAMITPFDERGGLDLKEAARIATWLVDRGNDGLVVAGTTGEGPALSEAERLDLFAAVKAAAGSRAVVIANTGGSDTRASVELTKKAEAAGADAILAVVPPYSKPPQDGMLGHFGAIARATKLPVVIYNIPGRSGSNMLPDTLIELAARHENIKGVKESSGDIAQFSEILRRKPKGFTFFCGDDHLFQPSLALGADGIVGVASHFCSREFAAMFEAMSEGRVAEAARLHLELVPLFKALFATSSPIPVKWAMNQFGFRAGEPRLPLGTMPEELKPALTQALARFRESAVPA
ncbi:MAG: 4-hydroxy-tetrahydrodipicolinate synthase, partial [Candidatus Eremiobacteraeota bacterium]|nr:4-hydroxy-tetrahydrodipicolinate synthase [Candidatus Eremiobacteraeota bacterium]